MYRNPETLTTFFSSGTKLLLPSWLLGFSTRGERDTIFTILTVPSDPTIHSASHSPNWTHLIQLQISTLLFFKITKNPTLLLPGKTSFALQSHFLSGVFIMTSVIVTSSTCEREHLCWMCVPACALSRIVLSLTKPNDKI